MSAAQVTKPEPNRHLADFHPDLWVDHFASFSPSPLETKYALEHQKLKEEVRKLLIAGLEKPSQQLDLIDSVQRLGIAYHFEDEIEKLLQKIHENLDTCVQENDNLHAISLLFRLLRQSGLQVSCDMFSYFKDECGNLKESLVEDIRGLLSLHEAANVRIHGENILEEAFDFTVTQLKSIANGIDQSSSPTFSEQASHALKYPILKNIPRPEAKYYISIYQQNPLHNNVLLTFAKLDFNILQKLHQKEVSEIARWWKDLDVPKKLPFARSRIVELYFWILGVYFEPWYALGRKITTKIIALCSVLDDIYDVYGTIEELELLTQAIQRWDTNAMDGLNECMKVFYQIMLEVYNEIGEDMAKLRKSYRLNYAIEMMKRQAGTYLIEVRWLNQDYTPMVEEYLKVGIDSTGYPLLILSSLLGMGDIVTEDVFDWAFSKPKMVIASALITRFIDDKTSNEFEQKRGHVDSIIECYMKEQGITRQEAVEELDKQIASAWKDINEEFVRPTKVPEQVLKRILNFTRVMHVMYFYTDGYTFAAHLHTKGLVVASLVDQLPLN